MDNKISVVIPVYGTEKYLKRCLDSVLAQTYKNIEVIVVNDCTPDDSQKIIDEYSKKDSRVKCVRYESNRGLFHARLAGADVATGEYIAFLDSDDYLSIDIYRLCVNKFEEINVDIVMYKFVRFNEKERFYIQNLIDFNLYDMSGDDFRKKFFEQEGLYYNYHTIWNKVYKKSLWDECRPNFEEIKSHLIMTEDVAFSCVLVSNCKKFGFVNEYGLFYLVREDASTSNNNEYSKIKKSINDIVCAFTFAQRYVNTNKNTQKYINNMQGFKERYYRMWYEVTDKYLIGKNRKECIKILQEGFDLYEHKYKNPEDFLAIEIETDWDPRYEDLKKYIASEKIEVVSFDIFDTLILRPFLEPKDIYYFLDIYYSEITDDVHMIDFSKIRIKAESIARKESKHEDVTLTEIYDVIYQKYDFDKNIIIKMLEKEKELEIEFTYRRESMAQVYEMAVYIGKKVILVSDMYLELDTIKKILEKNKYSGHEKLFLSSYTRKLKHTTNMFKSVLKELDIEPRKVLHVGDNWNADKIAPEKVGINGFFIPKTIHYLSNELNDKETGEIYDNIIKGRGLGLLDFEANTNLLNKCMLAVAVNSIYDNPFTTFNHLTDFNAKPEIVGKLAFGTHLLTLSKWLVEDSIKSDYKKIHFIARDGYMPKKGYDLLKKYYPQAPESNYIYASRKSIIPYLFKNKIDKYSILEMIAYQGQNRKNILNMIDLICKEDYDLEDINIDAAFKNEDEVLEFIDLLEREVVCEQKLQKYDDVIREYFSQIDREDATFDLGYSGRIQAIICDSISKNIDGYYLHKSQEKADKFCVRNKFNIKNFYNYKPLVSGACREYFYASNEHSCVGFEKNDDDIRVLFDSKGIEKYRHNIELLQENALGFIEEFLEIFKDKINLFIHNNVSSSLVMENYLAFPKEKDRHYTRMNFSEDFVHGGTLQSNLYVSWDYELKKVEDKNIMHNEKDVANKNNDVNTVNSKLEKLVYYYFVDRQEFIRRAKIKLMKKPFLYKTAYKCFWVFRKIRRG